MDPMDSPCFPVDDLLLSRDNWEGCHSLIKINGSRKSLMLSSIFDQGIQVPYQAHKDWEEVMIQSHFNHFG